MAAAVIALLRRKRNREQLSLDIRDSEGLEVPKIMDFNGLNDEAPDRRSSEASPAAPAASSHSLPHQAMVHAWYTNDRTQWLIAGLIFANFLVTIVNMQIDPHHLHNEELFRTIYDSFNVVFLIEILTNLYAHGRRFWCDGWNLFDAVVVTLGVLYLLRVHLVFSQILRVVRSVRVFRLFRRVKSLHSVISALTKAVPGVVNAFIIMDFMVLVMSIYALIAVEFFAPCPEQHEQVRGCARARNAPARHWCTAAVRMVSSIGAPSSTPSSASSR